MKEKVLDIVISISNKIPKRRNLLINREDVVAVIDILNSVDSFIAQWIMDVKIGNCGWAKAPECYYVSFVVDDAEWYYILKELKLNEITILPDYIGM